MRAAFINRLRAAGYQIGEERLAFFRGYIDQEHSPFDAFYPLLKTTPLALHLVSVSPQGGLIGNSAGSAESLDAMISDCRMTTLSDLDRRYIDARMPSSVMLSIGLLNLLRADRLLIPVYHETKADILRIMFATDPDPAIPATLLKLHGRATVITTRAIAERAFDGEDAVEIENERDAILKLGLMSV